VSTYFPPPLNNRVPTAIRNIFWKYWVNTYMCSKSLLSIKPFIWIDFKHFRRSTDVESFITPGKGSSIYQSWNKHESCENQSTNCGNSNVFHSKNCRNREGSYFFGKDVHFVLQNVFPKFFAYNKWNKYHEIASKNESLPKSRRVMLLLLLSCILKP